VDNNLTKSRLVTVDRRNFSGGLIAGGIVASVGLGSIAPAFAQQSKDVSVEKLMAPGSLPDITVGNKNAKITMVEYASMSCPHCAKFHKTVLPKFKEKYIDTGKVLLVMREFPLNQVALAVSMLTRCAGDNDKTAAMIDVYFEQQDTWLVRGNILPKLLELAKQAGFTEESFNKCLGDKELSDKLIKQRSVAGSQFGVNRTPSFFINGKAVQGDILDIEQFSKIIDPLLKKSS
jgi:protein-disulfide isomerase